MLKNSTTTPSERTQSLRLCWEFLLALEQAYNLSDIEHQKIIDLLKHFPSANEIKQWAIESGKIQDCFGTFIKPELNEDRSFKITSIKRKSVTCEERSQALLNAYNFIRFDLINSKTLTDKQKNQIPFVLRHFPEPYLIAHWIDMDKERKKINSDFRIWLA